MPRQVGATSCFDGIYIGLLPKTEQLKRINNARNMLAKLHEKWDNRMSFEGVFWPYLYLEGRLNLLVRVEFCTGGYTDRYVAIFHRDIGLGRDKSRLRRPFDRDDEPVFVDQVQFVQPPEGGILSQMRLHRDNMLPYGSGGPFYLSFPNSFLEGFGLSNCIGFRERKRDASRVATIQTNQLACEQIERGPQFVNGIADDKGKVVRDTINCPDYAVELSGLQIVLDENAIRVFSKKGFNSRLKVNDVALGPLNL